MSRDPGGSPDIPVYVERASSQGNPHPHPRPRRNGVLISDLLPNSFPRDSTQTILRFCVPDEPGRCRPKQKHLRACVGSRVAGVVPPPRPNPPPSGLAPGARERAWEPRCRPARGWAGAHGAGGAVETAAAWQPRPEGRLKARPEAAPACRCVVQPAPRSQGL